MAVGDYLALAWPAGDAEGAARADALGARLAAEAGWRLAGSTDRLRLHLPPAGAAPVEALPCAAGFVVGERFPTTGAVPAGELPRRPAQAARALLRSGWGRYVALLHGPPGETAVFRDPFGELDALVWPLGAGVEAVASDILTVPPWLRPPRLSLNWNAIAIYVALSSAMRAELLFDGVAAVAPGTLQPLPAGAPAEALWRPGDLVGEARPDEVEARTALAAAVDACTRALVGDRPAILMELSGGLDSAIVAGTLRRLGLAGRVSAWLNYVADRAEGDEQAYARAVTDRLGVPLTVVEKPLAPLTEADFTEVATGVRPALQAVDAPRDRDIAARMAAAGGAAVLSGQGGDAVFFQMPSVLVASGVLRREGLRGLGSPVLRAVAHRTRRSVWQVLAEAARAERRRGGLPSQLSPLAAPGVRAWLAGRAHPWVEDAGGIPGAKRLQIQAIANAQLYRGDCRKRRAGDLLYPFLCQPVVELCLAIPADVLAGGEQDRRLARAAFADRLPAAVLARRSKGELGAYYGRLLAASLDVLRPFLLDGCLAGAGVLDRAATARHLTSEQLLHAPATGPILTAVTAEAWVRHWQGRVGDSERAPRRRG